jgi:hypothetical protein
VLSGRHLNLSFDVSGPEGICRLRAPVCTEEQTGVTIWTREIYHSPNGDRWLLAHDSDTGRVFVRHEPNLASGGQAADIEVGAFLIAAGNGPEKQELLRLIATLVRGPPAPAA